jgi:hypothetical protein
VPSENGPYHGEMQQPKRAQYLTHLPFSPYPRFLANLPPFCFYRSRCSLPRYPSVYVQRATRRMEKSVNSHNRLIYFLTNKIFLLQFMYRYVRTFFIVNCVTITRFFIAYAALWWKSMIFIVLSSLETVHDTVHCRYCRFSLLYLFLRIRPKRQNPFLS